MLDLLFLIRVIVNVGGIGRICNSTRDREADGGPDN